MLRYRLLPPLGTLIAVGTPTGLVGGHLTAIEFPTELDDNETPHPFEPVDALVLFEKTRRTVIPAAAVTSISWDIA